MEKTIILLGTGASMRFCDFKSDEIWGVNGAYTTPQAMPEKHREKFWMSKLFMGDTMFSFETGTLNFDIDAMNKFAEKYNCEMISLNKMKLGKHVLNAKRYPYNNIIHYFGSELFTDTVCYMIAYALYTHSHHAISPHGVVRPELDCKLRLKLFGIDMVTTSEYKQSKGGVEHWLGVARGMGCEITNAPGSAIFSNPYDVPYGHWHRIKWIKKEYDPMGLIGKQLDPLGLKERLKPPTVEEADALYKKMKEAENEQNSGTTNEEWCEGNQSGVPVYPGGGR